MVVTYRWRDQGCDFSCIHRKQLWELSGNGELSRSYRLWLYFLCYLGMLLFVLCLEILSVCTPRKDGVLETPSFSKVVEVVM